MSLRTFGLSYNHAVDGPRLSRQMERVRKMTLGTGWWTLPDLRRSLEAYHLGEFFPEASLSAQLRHLRKPQFGGYTVEKRRRRGGTWEYRVSAPATCMQRSLFR